MPVRKRGDRWEVRVQIDGRRHEETLPKGASKADAVLYEAKLRRQAVDSVVGRPEKRTIGDLLDDYEKHARRNLKSYDKDLKYRIRVLRGRFGADSTDQVERIAGNLGATEGLSPAARNRYLAILRAACRAGKVGGSISLVGGESRRAVYLSRAEVDRLAKAAGKWGDIIRFAALTGLRRGEILKLTKEDIKDGVATLGSDTKTRRGRVVPLPLEAKGIAVRSIPFGISATNLNRVFRAARVSAGLPMVRFHDLRRTYGTWLAHSGTDITTVRDLLGHANVSQTNTYLGVADVERLRKAVKGLKTRPAAAPRSRQNGAKPDNS
jgi:integrase